MPYSKTCPVCLVPGSIIRPDAKTCSRDCSKVWNQMPRGEQQARLAALNPQSQVEKLKAEVFNNKVSNEEIVNEDDEFEPESVIEAERKFPLDILTKS